MLELDKKFIGAVIKKARKNAGLKQHELADIAGFTEKHLSRIENGKYLPKVEHFLALIDILNLTFEDFGYKGDKRELTPLQHELINKILTADANMLNIYAEAINSAEKILKFK